jgi:benzoyl-CoA reductase subunit BamC
MKRTRTIKTIKIDADKCTGCRACEVICAAYHAEPKYSIVNPARSRIQVFRCETADIYVPIRAGKYTEVECIGRNVIVINGKEYGECSFCRQACPSRDLFHEPDSKLPLECDMCGEPMPEGGPMCVQWCETEALTYEEKEIEEEVEEEEEETEVVEVL